MSNSGSRDDRHVLVQEMEMERDRGQEMAEVRKREREEDRETVWMIGKERERG